MNKLIFNLFDDDAYFRSLLGNDELRLFSGGVAPLDTKPPYITWQVISEVPTNAIDNRNLLNRCRVQFNFYSVDEREINEVKKKFSKRIERFGVVIGGMGPVFETETREHKLIRDVSFLTGD